MQLTEALRVPSATLPVYVYQVATTPESPDSGVVAMNVVV
jgi:hypothetical protein